jgi:hypothetical protein
MGQSYEYCISAGEGTLIDYGVMYDLDWFDVMPRIVFDSDFIMDDSDSYTVAVSPCDDDCETGK